jgi:neutral ceramidase
MRSVMILCAAACAVVSLAAAEFRAGVGRELITPSTPFWLSGYASRTRPAETVRSELWAKALALEDPAGQRLVLVTTDLIGLPREVSDAVATRVTERYGIARDALILNSSHTHAGPAVWPNLKVMFDLDAEDTRRAREYAEGLREILTRVVGAALADLGPARVELGRGEAGFAMNRREPTPGGIRLGVNRPGPVDHEVPVLKVSGPEGGLRAVLFGYACHCTTLGGDFFEIDGDYAGVAQRVLEAAHPGGTALFVMLCGGDQNPQPRGTLALAQQHGEELAHAVEQVLAGDLQPVRPEIRTAHREVDLDFAPHTRTVFEEEQAQSANRFARRRADLMLEAYDAGEPVRSLRYPVQAARLGGEVTFLALGGEVVVDYALRAKAEYPEANLVVAAYCHDVACYIPSARVLREGGYEAVDSMIYYGQPGPFTESVEGKVFAAINQVLTTVSESAAE